MALRPFQLGSVCFNALLAAAVTNCFLHHYLITSFNGGRQ